MPHKKLMFISNTYFDVQTKLARVHWRSHSNSYPIEIIEFILYKVQVLESAEHDVCWQYDSFLDSLEFWFDSEVSFFQILNDLSFT